MDASKIQSLLEQLDDEIDDLEETMSPLVKTTLSESASKLPVLDKAKLYVLVTYAIESILFSYLRLQGVKAREHPVFRELTRVKQYFEKIKAAENPVNQGAGKRDNLGLNKGAVQRIIAAGLAGNDKYDLERAEQKAKERARAHIKFTELSEQMKQDELSKKRKAEVEGDEEDQSSSDFDSDSEPLAEVTEEVLTSHKKKKRKSGKGKSLNTSEPTSSVSSPAGKSEKKEESDKMKQSKKKSKKKSKKFRFESAET